MKPQEVTNKNLNEYLNFLITEFHQNNLHPFFDALDEEVVWVGPMHNQYIHGKEEAIRAFRSEVGQMTFNLGTIVTEQFPHGRSQCDTVSFFSSTAYYHGGQEITLNHAYHISWVKKDRWKMAVISVTIRPLGDVRDRVYPLHLDTQKVFSSDAALSQGEHLMLREKDSGSALFILPQNIVWAESARHYSIIHVVDAEFTVAVSLSELDEMAGGVLLRCHSAYLVNPRFVRSIERFRITLMDGSTVPVPEKKYTAVKAELARMM